jgi:hypothetical protein
LGGYPGSVLAVVSESPVIPEVLRELTLTATAAIRVECRTGNKGKSLAVRGSVGGEEDAG